MSVNSQSSNLSQSTASQQQIAVERLISEARAGRAVAIRAGRSVSVVVSVEALDLAIAAKLEYHARRNSRLVLPAPRLRRLGMERDKPGVIAIPRIDLDRVHTLSLEQGARIDAPVATPSRIDLAALELMHLALVHPSVVVVPVSSRALSQFGAIEADATAILDYRATRAAKMTIVSRAPVPLEDAKSTEFVVFRGGEGLRDHVAINCATP